MNAQPRRRTRSQNRRYIRIRQPDFMESGRLLRYTSSSAARFRTGIEPGRGDLCKARNDMGLQIRVRHALGERVIELPDRTVDEPLVVGRASTAEIQVP